jgi:tRNA-Thr(GGU) m(6)t(6)A37 methyltransferase TsaA
MSQPSYDVVPIGHVESPLTDAATAPKQGREGSCLDRADRNVLRVHPRDDVNNPMRGVFGTRSADRPNPIGLHPVQIVEIDGNRARVRDLEALDGTPIVDVKPVI